MSTPHPMDTVCICIANALHTGDLFHPGIVSRLRITLKAGSTQITETRDKKLETRPRRCLSSGSMNSAQARRQRAGMGRWRWRSFRLGTRNKRQERGSVIPAKAGIQKAAACNRQETRHSRESRNPETAWVPASAGTTMRFEFLYKPGRAKRPRGSCLHIQMSANSYSQPARSVRGPAEHEEARHVPITAGGSTAAYSKVLPGVASLV
jgi:hypothetical protein